MLISSIATSIPSPSQGVWHLGPFPLRAYALCILIGIFIAAWLTTKRAVKRGATSDQVFDVTFIAVIFGIIGGRLYHVISSPRPYFGEGGNPIKALYIWEGGLGIWGAIALGALGAWIGCRRVGLKFSTYADAVAPALLIAQAIGRLGNWFNQELFGKPTTLPWGLEIDDAHLPAGFESGTLFHPTFLYELIWCLLAAALILWLDKIRTFKPGQVMWLYVMVYTVGRLWIESLRIDTAELVFGLRVNIWTSILIFVLGLVGFVIAGRRNIQVNDTASDETQDPKED